MVKECLIAWDAYVVFKEVAKILKNYLRQYQLERGKTNIGNNLT